MGIDSKTTLIFVCMSIPEVVQVFSSNWHIMCLFFLIANAYASVGFGGGSSYLAVLALTGIAYTQIRSTALLCNIMVVSGNVILYAKHKEVPWKKVLPLTLFSVPLAFIGGLLKINQTVFFILLGTALLIAASLMWVSKKIHDPKENKRKMSVFKNAGYGGLIGFISGMVGIGGGIFLAPLLHLSHWDRPKRIAATASFFILVNSVAGFLGQSSNPDFSIDWNLTVLLVLSVFIGGQIGTRMSLAFFNATQLKKATAVLIAFIGIKILLTYV